MQGQMCESERTLIHDTVVGLRPSVVMECGTWYGGGSTLAIATALQHNGHGVLLTYEPNRAVFIEAVRGYEQERPDLLPFVRFFAEPYPTHKLPLKTQLVVLDGPEDDDYTLIALDGAWRDGVGVAILHDWDRLKCAKARLRVNEGRWRVDRALDTLTGMAKLIRCEV